MVSVFQKRPEFLMEARKAKVQPAFVLQVLIFIAFFIVSSIAQAVPIVIYTFIAGFSAVANQEVSLGNPEGIAELTGSLQENILIPSLLCTGIATILAIIYCRFIEKRSLYSMGFTRKRAFADYGVGLIIGLVMFALCVLISWVSGSLQYNGFILGNGIVLLIGFFIGFVIQGMSEEVLLRGYFMASVANSTTILVAVLSNSVIFALLHIFNSGISVLAIVNLILFGLFTSIYTLKKNSIWGVCAIHSIWNFAQGNIFGIKVSGIDTKVSLFSFESLGSGTLINGGAFGLEGGLAVTIVLVAATIITLLLKGRGLAEENEARPVP